MDVIVIPAAYCRKAWTLADLLGRPMGCIMEARGPGFAIYPAERARYVMGDMPLGPFASLDDALRAVEECTHGACHHAPASPRSDTAHRCIWLRRDRPVALREPDQR